MLSRYFTIFRHQYAQILGTLNKNFISLYAVLNTAYTLLWFVFASP
jgi:hypothetical protein